MRVIFRAHRAKCGLEKVVDLRLTARACLNNPDRVGRQVLNRRRKQDMGAADDCLAEDVVFLRPVAQTPYPGKLITSAILRAVFEVFDPPT